MLIMNNFKKNPDEHVEVYSFANWFRDSTLFK